MSCEMIDRLVTPFIDGECTDTERAAMIAHMRHCESCRQRVEAESTAREVLHAHATVARTMGVAPAWRPRVYRLGRPFMPAPAAVLLALVAAAAGVFAFSLLRPVTLTAVGVIGDSRCQYAHRPAERFGVDEGTCTRNCVTLGAEYVLVTDTRIYRISNQDLPALSTFADARVAIKGRLDGDALHVASLAAAE